MPNPYVVSLDQQELKVKTYYRRGSGASAARADLPPARGTSARVRSEARGGRRGPRGAGHARPRSTSSSAVRGAIAACAGSSGSGIRLTTREEADRIRERGRDARGLDRRGGPRRRSASTSSSKVSTAGVAAHHAGMLPVFKETVEELFEEGLVKVVFATETLSLGINMPAKTVVIEDLWKFQGERHELLTPGEYTQLTGRAGRRGIDAAGPCGRRLPTPGAVRTGRGPRRDADVRPDLVVPALVQHGREPRPELLARASAPPVERLVRTVPRRSWGRRARAREGTPPRGARGVPREHGVPPRRLRRVLAPRREGQRSSATTIDAVASVPATTRSASRSPRCDPARSSTCRGPREAGSPSWSPAAKASPRCSRRTADSSGSPAKDFEEPPTVLTRIPLPRSGSARSSRYRRDVASALVSLRVKAPKRSRNGRAADPKVEKEAARSRPSRRTHPCHTCPERAKHERWAARASQLERQLAGVERRIRVRTETLARRFDRVLAVLQDLGYVDGWATTDKGGRLARIYGEGDVLVGELLAGGLLEDLSPPEVAALISTVVYEASERNPLPGHMPTAVSAGAIRGPPAALAARAPHRRRTSGAALSRARGRVRDPGVPLGRGKAARGRACAKPRWPREISCGTASSSWTCSARSRRSPNP